MRKVKKPLLTAWIVVGPAWVLYLPGILFLLILGVSHLFRDNAPAYNQPGWEDIAVLIAFFVFGIFTVCGLIGAFRSIRLHNTLSGCNRSKLKSTAVMLGLGGIAYLALAVFSHFIGIVILSFAYFFVYPTFLFIVALYYMRKIMRILRQQRLE